MGNIYVYSWDNDDYSTIGECGALDATSCTFEEVGGGMSEIELVHPIDAMGKFAFLQPGAILKANVAVRTTPEIENGQFATRVESWKIKQTATKQQRYVYTKMEGGRKSKTLKLGAAVIVTRKPADSQRWKIKSGKTSGWIDSAALENKVEISIPGNLNGIEDAAPSWESREQLFRIYKINKSDDGISCNARHIQYDLLQNLTSYNKDDAVTLQQSGDAILDQCMDGHDFRFYTDIIGTQPGAHYTDVDPVTAFLDPDSGLLAAWNAQLVRDNYDIYMLSNAGMDRGMRISYGKNMLGVEYDESTESTATAIRPIGEKKNGDPLYLSGSGLVMSTRADQYPFKRIYPLKCTDCTVGTNGVTTAIALARMQEQAEALFEEGADLPDVSLKVTFANLGRSKRYEDYRNLENVYLYDTVTVCNTRLGIDVKTQVVRIMWDCLVEKMLSVELGSLQALSPSVASWQISGGISGSKLIGGSVGAAQLRSGAISARHVQAESINTEALQAESVTAEKIASRAITADKLDVGSVTADTIAAGAIDAEKIAAGAIDAISIDAITAKIDSLTAEDITTDRLAAALAAFTVVTAGTASFDKATVSHLVANLFNLTGSGVMDDVFIHNLKIAYAQMVSASIGNLVLQASNGEYYQIDVDQDGSVSATLVEPSAEEIASGVFGQTRPILATSMTVDDMNASSIKAVHMLINKIDAARIDVDQLFARQAFITQLTTRSIIGGKSLTIIAGEAEGAASAAKNAVKTYRQESAPDVADGVKNGDLWIKPSTGAISQADAIEFVLDENGDLYLNHGSGDGHSARFASGDPTMLETTFAMTLNADGEIISMPVTWMLVQDQTLANRINSNATLKVDVEYALCNSNEIEPITGWSTDAPAQAENKYIWSRTVTYFGDGTKSTGAASCLSTSLGKGISQIIEQYAVSGNAETAPTDGWSETAPTASANQYIWTRSEIVYVDGSKSHTPPQVQAKRYADILTDNLLDKVDGKTTVFYDPNEPETPNEGDLWYDTDADPVTIQRYSSGAWVEVTDSMLKKALDAAGEAKYIADKKIVTFAQDEAPTSGMSEGDLWIDTNDGNKLHRYNGTAWVAYQDASISQAQSAAETANAAAIAASESASEALTKANAAAKQADFQRVVRIDNAGLHVGDNITDTEVLITSGSVNVVVGGVSKSTFGDNFVRLGNALISNTNNGLVIDLYGG